MRRSLLAAASLVAAVGAAACEERLNPTMARTPIPRVTAPTGEYTLRAVDAAPLPHDARQGATIYSLVSGTFILGADSSWVYLHWQLSAHSGFPQGFEYIGNPLDFLV